MKVSGIINEMSEKIAYTAVVLDEQSRELLLDIFKEKLDDGYQIIAHHMTINIGPIKEKYADRLGEEVELTVFKYAEDEKVKAVQVSGFPSDNPEPHITLSVNRDVDGKPVDSNFLDDWEVVTPFKVKGTVEQVEVK